VVVVPAEERQRKTKRSRNLAEFFAKRSKYGPREIEL
jgi:hypothetical protein